MEHLRQSICNHHHIWIHLKSNIDISCRVGSKHTFSYKELLSKLSSVKKIRGAVPFEISKSSGKDVNLLVRCS